MYGNGNNLNFYYRKPKFDYTQHIIVEKFRQKTWQMTIANSVWYSVLHDGHIIDYVSNAIDKHGKFTNRDCKYI